MDQDKLEFLNTMVEYRFFIKVFDGDINKWKKYLKEKASAREIAEDSQFVLQLEKKLKEDPGLLDRIKELVRQYEEAIKELRGEG